MLIDQFLGLQTTESIVGWIQFSWTVSPLVWTGYLTKLSNSVCYVGVKTFAIILDVLQGPEYYPFSLVSLLLSTNLINPDRERRSLQLKY